MESKWTCCKVALCHSVIVSPTSFSYTHKVDHFFESCKILIEVRPNRLCPYVPFICYLITYNPQFPLHTQLWLHSTGQDQAYSWVVHQLKSCLGSNIVGHSFHSGSTTSLTLTGTPDDHIKAHGWWSSQVYHTYIWKHLVILQFLLHSCSTFDSLAWDKLLFSLHHHSYPSKYFFLGLQSLLSISIIGALALVTTTPHASEG